MSFCHLAIIFMTSFYHSSWAPRWSIKGFACQPWSSCLWVMTKCVHVLLFFYICESGQNDYALCLFLYSHLSCMHVSVSVSKRGLTKPHKLNGCDPLVIWGSFSLHFLRNEHLLSYYITCYWIVLGLFIPKKTKKSCTLPKLLVSSLRQTILCAKALSSQMWKLYLFNA